jgi:hypothetical protein
MLSVRENRNPQRKQGINAKSLAYQHYATASKLNVEVDPIGWTAFGVE